MHGAQPPPLYEPEGLHGADPCRREQLVALGALDGRFRAHDEFERLPGGTRAFGVREYLHQILTAFVITNDLHPPHGARVVLLRAFFKDLYLYLLR